MHNHSGHKEVVKGKKKVILVGNSNVGKSVTFGILTGHYVVVSNYPGTTVEISQGSASFDDETLIIDTPGINNLIPMSEDEKVTRDILLKEKPDAVVQVADSKNLRRALIITTQLAEMGVPIVLNLNMEDEAISRGINIDRKRLQELFDIPVISTVATQRKGSEDLIKTIKKAKPSSFKFTYAQNIENVIRELEEILPDTHIKKRSLAIMVLSGDESLREYLNSMLDPEKIKKIDDIRSRAQESFSHPLSYVISRRRLEVIDQIVKEVVKERKIKKTHLSQKLGELSMHHIWGIPILIGVLMAMFIFVGVFGAGTLVNFIQGTIFDHYINPLATEIVKTLIPVGFLQDLLVGEYGIITMALTYSIAIVLPIVGTFFLAFGILEDSGYLPRLSLMVNRVFKFMGLNGKAVLPMILGLGCDTMATLTARIMETRKQRIIVTLLLALAVPCSAQLGVVLGMLARLSAQAAIIWAGVVLLVIVLVGYLSSKVILGRDFAFMIELPPMRVPQPGNIAIKTLARIEWYLREAVPLFILGTLILFFLDKVGALITIQKLASPLIVNLLGLPPQATNAFLVGFVRRDYGAAGLFVMANQGLLDPIQIVVSLVTITLFVPCIANFFIMIKERGIKTALAMVSFIIPFAFMVGAVLNFVLRASGVSL